MGMELSIRGLGVSSISKILTALGLAYCQRFSKLHNRDIADFKAVSWRLLKDTNVDAIKAENISRKVLPAVYSGRRHVINMPVRGQRTRTNARSRVKFNIS